MAQPQKPPLNPKGVKRILLLVTIAGALFFWWLSDLSWWGLFGVYWLAMGHNIEKHWEEFNG